MPGASRWWRRETDENLLAAREVKGRAAVVLLELDTLQRDVEAKVGYYGDFSAKDGDRVAGAWAPLRDAAFAATNAYLQVEQHHDLEQDLPGEQARTAGAEYERVAAEMESVAGRVAEFDRSSEPQFAQVRAAVARRTVLLQEVEPALARARSAVADARVAGLRTVDPDVELELAERAARVARADDSVEGLQRSAQAAREATEHARTVVELAGALPERRTEVTRRISSTRTRLQITNDRVSTVDEVLSELRQRYAAAASADFGDVGARVAEHLRDAERGVFDARNSAAENAQRWGDAEEALVRARAASDEAEAVGEQVRARLDELDAMARDPRPPLAAARRTLRDAQRYLLDSAPTLDRRLAGVLDGLAARLDATEREVGRRRPSARVDHWAYREELRAVTDGAGAVVAEVRGRRRPPGTN